MHAAAARYGTWVAYGGAARLALGIVLLAAAGGAAWLGTRPHGPFRTVRPRRATVVVMVAAWVFAIAAFLAGGSLYVRQALRAHLAQAPPADPITPVTVIGVGAVFLVILIASTHGWRVRLASAAIGALAAPMIFELPFDLIVMARTYPPIPPDPALYRALFFVPLFLVELTTLALLTLSPMARPSTAAFLFFASMLFVFAIWAFLGFGYPSAPAPFALNVLSKILAFLTVLSLFLPVRGAERR
ncbi:MAG TPA: hypothetical protein VGL93_10095 [Streptosporangiaceae bacterium]